MFGGQDVHRTVAVVTEAALLVAYSAAQIGQMSFLSMTRDIVFGMRIGNRVAIMTGLTIVGDTVAVRAMCLRFRRRRTMQGQPVQHVVPRSEFILGHMAKCAVGGDQFLGMTLHALVHAGEVSHRFRRKFAVQIIVARRTGESRVCVCGMIEFLAVVMNTRTGIGIADMAGRAFIVAVDVVALHALIMGGEKIILARRAGLCHRVTTDTVDIRMHAVLEA